MGEKKKRKESNGDASGGDETGAYNMDAMGGGAGGDYSSAPTRSFRVIDDPAAYLYDADTFLEWILKMQNGNFAGNMMLAWGTIPLQI